MKLNVNFRQLIRRGYVNLAQFAFSMVDHLAHDIPSEVELGSYAPGAAFTDQKVCLPLSEGLLTNQLTQLTHFRRVPQAATDSTYP